MAFAWGIDPDKTAPSGAIWSTLFGIPISNIRNNCIITRLFKYIENFTTKKEIISDKKKSDISPISAQNINCGYSLEPPSRGGSNEYPQIMVLSKNKKNHVYPC